MLHTRKVGDFPKIYAHESNDIALVLNVYKQNNR